MFHIFEEYSDVLDRLQSSSKVPGRRAIFHRVLLVPPWKFSSNSLRWVLIGRFAHRCGAPADENRRARELNGTCTGSESLCAAPNPDKALGHPLICSPLLQTRYDTDLGRVDTTPVSKAKSEQQCGETVCCCTLPLQKKLAQGPPMSLYNDPQVDTLMDRARTARSVYLKALCSGLPNRFAALLTEIGTLWRAAGVQPRRDRLSRSGLRWGQQSDSKQASH
jgi:hypothetical protein